MNFFANENKSMAEFLADKGILVVGIDYPETNIEFNHTADYKYMATIGQLPHAKAVHKKSENNENSHASALRPPLPVQLIINLFSEFSTQIFPTRYRGIPGSTIPCFVIHLLIVSNNEDIQMVTAP
jgi:hypothetical protein